MSFSPTFFRIMALCALAATLLLLASLVMPAVPRFDGADGTIRSLASDEYRLQGWRILIQVFFMFLALWGVFAKLNRRHLELAATAMLLALLWQVMELIPRAVELFALSGALAPEYLATDDPATRATLGQTIQAGHQMMAAIGEVRRLIWGLMQLLFGLALYRCGGIARIAAAFSFLIVLRMLASLLGLGGGFFTGTAMFLISVTPFFALVALWLWREPEVLPALT